MRFQVGSRVRNVRRPDVIGVVTSLDAPANQWKVRPEDFRITVKYPRVTKTSNGKCTGEKPHEAYTELLKKNAYGVVANIGAWDKKKANERKT